jgi:hydroxymethylbilane synthase
MNHRLMGGCQVPIAGHAVLEGETIAMRGLVGTPDGRRLLYAERRAGHGEAEALGAALAEDLIAQGADEILRALAHV